MPMYPPEYTNHKAFPKLYLTDECECSHYFECDRWRGKVILWNKERFSFINLRDESPPFGWFDNFLKNLVQLRTPEKDPDADCCDVTK